MKPLMAFLALTVIVVACNDDITGLGPPSDPAIETFAPSLGVNIGTMLKTPSGVYYTDLVVGTGLQDSAKADSIEVDYAGYLKDGAEFDGDSGVTFIMAGVAAPIVGFRTGIYGMREGGRRVIVIPSALGYGGQVRRGDDGQILIPRQSTLVFDIQLLKLYNKVEATPSSVVAGAGYRRDGF